MLSKVVDVGSKSPPVVEMSSVVGDLELVVGVIVQQLSESEGCIGTEDICPVTADFLDFIVCGS